MKKRAIVLLLVLAMLMSLAMPALAADDDDAVMTVGALGTLSEDFQSLLPEGTGSDTALTWNMAIAYLLLEAGMPMDQLGNYPDDYIGMADSLGMISYDYDRTFEDGTTAITAGEFEELSADDGLAALADAMSAETKSPLFVDGLAQPIFPFTTGAVEEGYSNADSDIIRFCVYVETDYDTDGDGKLDLVKALVQLPRAAAEGDYQAATIYEARPYITGCTNRGFGYGDGDLDFEYDYNPYTNKVGTNGLAYRDSATSTITDWESSLSFVNAADSADWYYYNPYERMMDYEDLDWYDYYLVRGFAVVECGGIGTRGSEGFESCGANIEIDAFKCVIEWLNGTSDRNAYTDKNATTAVEAYWSNGSVGMTGRSYAGTTQFGLATTGVKGLKTIVPVAGISSWYEYTNSQGISTRSNVAYTNTLAAYCAGRYLDSADGASRGVVNANVADFASIEAKYTDFLGQMQAEQIALNGDYGDHWAIRDYTVEPLDDNWTGINCPALIVHGLNDYNVRPKMFQQMYDTFKAYGQEVKLLLHQDGHLTPTYPAGNLVFDMEDTTYDEILNQWFTYYLYGEDYDLSSEYVDAMPAVLAEDSHEAGVWNEYDSWEAAESLTLTSSDDSLVDISSDYSSLGVTRSNWQNILTDSSTPFSAMYTTEVTEDMLIKGYVTVNFSATTDVEDRDALMVSAMLVDIAPEGETFPVFNTSGSYVTKTTLSKATATGGGAWMGGGLANYDLTIHNTTDVSYKIIARGWMDLANPNAGYDSASAARTDKVELGSDKSYDYSLYLQPNVYEVAEGHTLALVIYTYELGMANYKENYTFTVDNSSVSVSIPVDEGAAAAALEYQEPADLVYLSVAASDSKIGKVSSDYTTGPVLRGTEVTVTATANSGYHLDGWTVNGLIVDGTGNQLKVTVTEDTRIIAQFAEDQKMQPVTPVAPASPAEPEEPEVTTAYADVAASDWYYDAVTYVTENGLMNGVGDDSFAPTTNITRGMMVTILYRLDGSPAVSASSTFADVAAGAYYSDAVAWASANGIVNGVTDTTFDPTANITREQLAAMLYRYAQFKGYDVSASEALTGYTDADSVSDYAVSAMQWAVGAGLVNGRTATTIAPQGTASRAEAAAMLMRFVENIAK